MASFLKAELKGLLDLLLPPACALCGVTLQPAADEPFCQTCRDALQPPEAAACPRCALPYPLSEGSHHLCGACLQREPPFLWARALGPYEGRLGEAVRHFKYHGAVHLDRPLANVLARRFEDIPDKFRPDLLIPVPLHRRRLQARTYNHALLLARELGRLWGLPAPARLLRRVRPTAPQQGLSADLRRRNLEGAFAVRHRLAGETVLLIDDVLTTGATAGECAATLLAAGASSVAVVALARARLQKLS